MPEIQGVVTETNQMEVNTKNGLKQKYGLKIDDEWYNGWDTTPYKEGDKVTIEYDTNPNLKDPNKPYRNVKSIEKIGAEDVIKSKPFDQETLRNELVSVRHKIDTILKNI